MQKLNMIRSLQLKGQLRSQTKMEAAELRKQLSEERAHSSEMEKGFRTEVEDLKRIINDLELRLGRLLRY